MTTRLFSDNEQFTVDGNVVSDLVEKNLEKVLDDCEDAGYSLRDTYTIITLSASALISERIIKQQIVKRRLANNSK